ncbi:MAG: cytochrome c maturation protein CcmE [Anaerolineae bacterium]|jgi:cytochrome c-type biogenesis protein CcmE|nr:cytochrome c maturation protein CcmE [Anaerolineae bacterium]
MDWTKESIQQPTAKLKAQGNRERIKFAVGGLLLVSAVAFLLVSGTLGGVRFFITIDELLSGAHPVGETVRITGAVIGESIQYDPQTLDLSFTIAHMSVDTPDLARALHEAVLDPNAPRLTVYMTNQVKPDLLRNEAQAILTGSLQADGRFYGDSVLLKCPSRFDDPHPGEAVLAAEGNP